MGSLPPQSHKAYQAATPCCANYLWSKGGYLRFSHSMTHRLHKRECQAWNLLAKEPLAWSSLERGLQGWNFLGNAPLEWSLLGNGRLGWSSWVKATEEKAFHSFTRGLTGYHIHIYTTCVSQFDFEHSHACPCVCIYWYISIIFAYFSNLISIINYICSKLTFN